MVVGAVSQDVVGSKSAEVPVSLESDSKLVPKQRSAHSAKCWSKTKRAKHGGLLASQGSNMGTLESTLGMREDATMASCLRR